MLGAAGLHFESELLFRVARAHQFQIATEPSAAELLQVAAPARELSSIGHVRAVLESDNLASVSSDTFNTILNGLLQTNRIERAQSVFKDMLARNLPISGKTLEPLIAWHCNNGRVEAALSLFDQVRCWIANAFLDCPNISSVRSLAEAACLLVPH